jgi:hypothetical protein
MTSPLLVYLAPLATALLGLALAVVALARTEGLAAVRAMIRGRRDRDAHDQIAGSAARIVALVYQEQVSLLKDPSRPGLWDEAAQRAARTRAMEDLRHAAPVALATLAELGYTPADRDAVCLQAIESAVVQLERQGPAQPPEWAIPPMPQSFLVRGPGEGSPLDDGPAGPRGVVR